MRFRLAFLALLGILLPGPGRYAVAAQTGDSLAPPRTGLLRVVFPDLSNVEPDVREQLASLQKALASTAASRGTTASVLSEAYGVLGQHYQAYALNAPARECYLNASRLAPKEFRWVYLLGTLDQQEDRVEEAIEQYRLARTLRPDYVPVAVNLGNVLLQMNRPQDAEPNFRAALATDADSAAAHYGLGQIALSRRDYAEAVTRFQRALALVPGANRIHYALAMAYRGVGDTEKAKAHLARQGTVGVRVDDPLLDGLQDLIRSERIHLARGKVAAESGRYTDAADEFRKALAANSNSLTAHVNLGAVLVQTGDVAGAAAQFQAALRIDPKNTNAHFNLAILLSKSGRHDAAVPHLQAVVGLQPDDPAARFFLAQELSRAQRPEEALAEISVVVKADPNNEEALLMQVRLLLDKREYQQALASLARGHERQAQAGQTALWLAYLLATVPEYRLRDGALALKLAQAIYQGSKSPEHGAIVAVALAELGRCAEAAEWQRRMVAAAREARNADLVAKLEANLALYDGKSQCRP